MAVFDRNVTYTKLLFSLYNQNRCRLNIHSIARSRVFLNSVTTDRMSIWLKAYENFVGLSSVREAQKKVISVSCTLKKP